MNACQVQVEIEIYKYTNTNTHTNLIPVSTLGPYISIVMFKADFQNLDLVAAYPHFS
jgi:hypothetical protein